MVRIADKLVPACELRKERRPHWLHIAQFATAVIELDGAFRQAEEARDAAEQRVGVERQMYAIRAHRLGRTRAEKIEFEIRTVGCGGANNKWRPRRPCRANLHVDQAGAAAGQLCSEQRFPRRIDGRRYFEVLFWRQRWYNFGRGMRVLIDNRRTAGGGAEARVALAAWVRVRARH